ncbi:MAG: caspase domain-containing protein, partial [Pseudorhodoplanes sp.]
PLGNPARDAAAVGALLKQAGFDVTSALDLDKSSMSRALRTFTRSVSERPEDAVVLIYYAGHGLQVDGENFLIPTDAVIAQESDVAVEAMRLADVMTMLETVRSKTRIVILDACRDNPFADMAKTAPRGLALVNAPAGTLIAYSTSPGNTADDGSAGNSPFAAALLKSAREPGLPIETALKNVRLAVHGVTGGRQTPWEVSALIEPFSFFPGGKAVAADPSAAKNTDAWRKELRSMSPRQAAEVAIREDNVIVYEVYLSIYGGDVLAAPVRAILDRRQMMIAWLEAVTLNTASAFEAFLRRFPNSDLAETARRLQDRTEARSSFARSITPVLGLSANALNNAPQTIVREVRVPVEVIREVKVPGPVREIIKEVKVPGPVREIIKEVKVPGPVREIIKEVKVPGPVREIIKEVKVPGPVKIVPGPVKIVPGPVKIVHVPGLSKPCRCGGGGNIRIPGGVNQGGHRFQGGGRGDLRALDKALRQLGNRRR